MYGLKIIAAPTADAVSLSEAKEFLRISDDDPAHTATLDMLRDAATEQVQALTGRQFVQATFEQTMDGFPLSQPIVIARSPLVSVTSIKYRDAAGAEQTLDPSAYIAHPDREPGLIEPVTRWPATACREDAVTVRFIAGYPAGEGSPGWPAANVPGRAKTAILGLVAHWFDNRSPVVIGTITADVPSHVDRLIRGLRVWQEA